MLKWLNVGRSEHEGSLKDIAVRPIIIFLQHESRNSTLTNPAIAKRRKSMVVKTPDHPPIIF